MKLGFARGALADSQTSKPTRAAIRTGLGMRIVSKGKLPRRIDGAVTRADRSMVVVDDVVVA